MNHQRIFISHRHDDELIAETVTKHLQEWSVDAKTIFRSSDPKGGLAAGDKIKEAIKEKLENVNLLILLYTYADVDWSHCMWECGITEGQATAKTRIVVFQCTEDEPTVYRNEVRVKITPNGIRSFVEDFHKTPGFIPSAEGEAETAFQPKISEDVIVARSERMFSDLDEAIPSGIASSKHLWDFIRLSLGAKDVAQIKNSLNENDAIQKISESVEIREPRFVGIGNSVDTAVRQFGYGSYENGLKLTNLVNRWRASDKTKKPAWIFDVHNALYRCITNTPSAAVANTFKSVREDADWWFFPVVTRMRNDRDDSIEFDMYLIRVPSSSPVVGSTRKSTKPKSSRPVTTSKSKQSKPS